MKNDKKNVITIISKIMVEKLKVDPSLITDENCYKPLTGNAFSLNRLDMTYLFFEVEKDFDIRIDTTKILNYEFNTINGIADLVMDSK